MKVSIPKGKYIVAVSGGVDSMVLLDLLKDDPKLQLTVAHFDHGIRKESAKDRELVASIAKKHNLQYEEGYGHLGRSASEEKARKARYDFLMHVKSTHKADSIITAHHQDDLIETALMNLLRGTGARGLASMHTSKEVTRPLLGVSKKDIINYAVQNKLVWHEDSTNNDAKYLRNYIRKNITPLLNRDQSNSMVENIEKIAKMNDEKEKLIATISQNIVKNNNIVRSKYSVLPREVRSELIMYWMRGLDVRDFDKKTVDNTDIYLKTGRAGSKHQIKKNLLLLLQANTARFELQT